MNTRNIVVLIAAVLLAVLAATYFTSDEPVSTTSPATQTPTSQPK